ncbi:HlyD family secretion protein [Oceanibacterium hippocampi]|nr:HlyD family secretion protein [Oceanibacterium hippocampi]
MTPALADPPRRRRRRWLRPLMLLLGPLLVIAAGGYVYLTGSRFVGTENAYLKADKVMISAEVTGLLTEVAVRENQHVAKGDVLFRIDDRSYRIALDEAEAKLAGVRDQIADLKAVYRQKVEERGLAKANIAFAQREFERQASLLKSRATPESKYDTARHALDVARLQLPIIDQQLAQIRAQLGGDPASPVEQHASYRAAVAERDRAALELARTVVVAPLAGIASNTPDPGQVVVGSGPMSSPVMSVVADDGFWIEANFKETELTHVRPGQPVEIRVDTYPDAVWEGTVASISQATGAEFSVIPPQNATGNWIKVVQRIPVRIALPGADAAHPLRAGMSAIVEIDTGHEREMPGFLRTALSWIGIAPRALAASSGKAAAASGAGAGAGDLK